MNAIRWLAVTVILAAAVLCPGVSAQQNPGTATSVPVQPPPTVEQAIGYAPYVISRDGRVMQYQNEAIRLAQQYAKAEKEDEKKDIKKKLADVLGQQFEAHTQQQQKEVEDLEKQLAHLKTVLKKRQEAKSAIIDRRTEQLLLEAEGLGWNVPGTAPANPYRAAGGLYAVPVPATAPAPKR